MRLSTRQDGVENRDKVYVKEKCSKFLAIPGIFWNFFDGLKSQGITKKFHLYISGNIYLPLLGI